MRLGHPVSSAQHARVFWIVNVHGPVQHPRGCNTSWARERLEGGTFPEAGVTLQLVRQTIVDPPAALIGIVALVLLVRFNTNSAWLVIGGGAAGLVFRALSSG